MSARVLELLPRQQAIVSTEGLFRVATRRTRCVLAELVLEDEAEAIAAAHNAESTPGDRAEVVAYGVLGTLDRRQQELIEQLANGKSVGEVSQQLALAHRTVQRAISDARRALNCRTTAQLIWKVANSTAFAISPRQEKEFNR